MPKKLPTLVPPVRPETDYEFGQRENESIDRAAWHGHHPMGIGPKNLVHTEEMSLHIPHAPRPKK